MRHAFRAPRRARETVTAWWPWGATCTCLEGARPEELKVALEVIQDAAMLEIVLAHAR
jgi:hypothetical protein